MVAFLHKTGGLLCSPFEFYNMRSKENGKKSFRKDGLAGILKEAIIHVQVTGTEENQDGMRILNQSQPEISELYFQFRRKTNR